MFLENEKQFDGMNDYPLRPLHPGHFGSCKCRNTGLQLFPVSRHAYTKGPHKGVSSNFSEQYAVETGLLARKPHKLYKTKGVKISNFGRKKWNTMSYVKGAGPYGGAPFLYDTYPLTERFAGIPPTGVYGMVGATAPRNPHISPPPALIPNLPEQFKNPLLPWGGMNVKVRNS